MTASKERFKVEILNLPSEPFWFDTREELDAHVALLRGCPIDDGPIKLRITTYRSTEVRTVEL